MAQKITSISTHGLFTAGSITLNRILSTGNSLELTADLSDCKDSVIALVNIPSGVTGTHKLVFIGSENGKETEVELTTGTTNIIRFTTKGIKDSGGAGKFRYESDSTTGLSELNITIGFVKYSEVINH